MDNTRELFALANLVLCLSAVGMCLCRLNSITQRVYYRIQIKYVVALTAAMTSAVQPFWGEWPGWGSLAMSTSLVFALIVGKQSWYSGPPQTVCDPSKEETPCDIS